MIEVIAAVCAAGARAETDGLVGLAYEHRVPLDVSEQRDQHDRVAALLVELTHRMDQAHGRLAAVHDRQPREGALQHPRFSYRIADRRELVRRPRPGRPAARSCCRPRARRARCSSVRATAREWSPRGLRCVCQRLRRSPSPDLLPGTCACGRSRGAPGCGALRGRALSLSARSPDHADYLALKARGLSHTRASLTITRKLARRSFHVCASSGPGARGPARTPELHHRDGTGVVPARRARP